MNTQLAIGCVLLLIGSLPADSPPLQTSNQGVVVEEITRGSAADLAGLREGDTIENWSRGEAHGEIDFPFELTEIEIEQAPRGVLTLRGRRQTAPQLWKLDWRKWGIQARPQLPESLLSAYRQGHELAKEGRLADAVEQWTRAAKEATESGSKWMASWFLSRAAKLLANASRWKEADAAYQASIQQAVESVPATRIQLLRMWAIS